MKILISFVSVFVLSALLWTSPVFGVVNQVNDNLMQAMRGNNIQAFKDALAKGVNVNALDKDGGTPLMYIAPNTPTEIVKLLLEKGANVNIKDWLGWTPLMTSALYGRTEIGKLLIEKGAKVNEKSNAGWTPLMYAAYNGHIEIGKLLIEKGADVNTKSRDGQSALSLAEARMDSAFVEMLKHAGAK